MKMATFTSRKSKGKDDKRLGKVNYPSSAALDGGQAVLRLPRVQTGLARVVL